MNHRVYMIHSVKFKCVLDTNVIYPLEIRDILFWFAFHELYTIKWSKHIFDEWLSVMIRKNVDINEAEKRIKKAEKAFPDAYVHNYEPLMDKLNLPDKNDCHVLAAAIKTNADLIVTNNIKDFPEDYLSLFDLKAKTADDFLTDLIDLNQKQSVKAFRDLVLNRNSPHLNEFEMLDIFRNRNLEKTANYLHTLI